MKLDVSIDSSSRMQHSNYSSFSVNIFGIHLLKTPAGNVFIDDSRCMFMGMSLSEKICLMSPIFVNLSLLSDRIS